MIICVCCGRDIDEIGQDNVSLIPGSPICEDCNGDDEIPMDECLTTDNDF